MARFLSVGRHCVWTVLLTLCACGGGGEGGSSSASSALTPTTVSAEPAPRQDSSTVLPPALAPLAAQALDNRFVAQGALDISPSQFFDWASRSYANLFNGPFAEGNFNDIIYRFYPSTGNFIGVSNNTWVYAYGAVTNNQLLSVGTVQGYTCSVMPEWCLAAKGVSSPAFVAFEIPKIDLLVATDKQDSKTLNFTVRNMPPDLSYAALKITGEGLSTSGLMYVGINSGFRSIPLYNKITSEPGTYSGTIQLVVCKNTACTSTVEVIGTEIPYTVTVVPKIRLSVTGVIPGVPYYVKPNESITINSNRPVTWRTSSGEWITTTSSTPFMWTGYAVGFNNTRTSVTATAIDTKNDAATAVLAITGYIF